MGQLVDALSSRTVELRQAAVLALSRLTKNDPDNQEQVIQAGGGQELLRIARDEASDAPLVIETRELAKATLGNISADLGSEAAQALDAHVRGHIIGHARNNM